MDIKAWFDSHQNTRLAVKYLILGAASGLLYFLTNDFVTSVPVTIAPLYTAALAWINERFNVLSLVNAPWPVIGAQAKPPVVGPGGSPPAAT
jgi:hypothetical protein